MRSFRAGMRSCPYAPLAGPLTSARPDPDHSAGRIAPGGSLHVVAKKMQATVFVVDDDESVRSSLRFLLRSVGLESRAFASAHEFLASYDPSQPGCLVLDVRMPGISGLELQQDLNVRGAIIPVIFITGHGDVPMAVEAMRHGAHDFLQKPFRDQDLIDRIQKALAKDAKARAALEQHESIRARLETLTPRERDVLALMAQGKPNKVMAHELGVSQRTVEIHRARVMEKSAASSLAQLVRMVMDVGPPAGKPQR
jgi:two-component system, LuxR family, response regulator FixJ